MSIAIADDVERVVRMEWRGKQSEALLDSTKYLDIEGAIRSSKTTIGLWKVVNSCLEHPGIRWLVTRWIEDDVNVLIKPLLGKIFNEIGTEARWIPDEHRFELPNDSWIYIRGLRPSENTSRFSKFRGMTLAGVLVDQAEEIPEDFALELKGRLSQTGYPHQLIFTPNPPGLDHWLAKMFPDTESGADTAPDHRYIRLTLDDNAHNLEADYVEGLKREYHDKPTLYRRLIDGKRGLAASGTPVYRGYFVRERHAVPVKLNPEIDLIECIDFGYHHPCVLWLQFQPWGEMTWLGGVMGEDMYIEDFAPLIQQYRAQWWGGYKNIASCCDPAGSKENSQGTRRNGVSILKENSISPRWVDHSNTPDARDYAIQTIAGFMRRRTVRGEGFQIGLKRWQIISAREAHHSNFAIDALEAGYVFDERVRRTAGGRTLTVPLKDGYYEHVMNCAEYGVLNFGPARPSVADERKARERLEQAVTKKDRDPMDQPVNRYRRSGTGGSVGPRGGYA